MDAFWLWLGRFDNLLSIAMILSIPIVRWSIRKFHESRLSGIDKQTRRMTQLYDEPRRFGFMVMTNAFLVLTCLSASLMTSGFAGFDHNLKGVSDLLIGAVAYLVCVDTLATLQFLRDFESRIERLRTARAKLTGKLKDKS